VDDLWDKIIAGAAGGLLSSTITATAAYIVGRKQRRQTLQVAANQSLEKFIDDSVEYAADAEKLVDLTQELSGQGAITPKDLDNLFVLHNVDCTPKTPNLLQKGQKGISKISEETLEKQRRSTEARRELWILYKDAKLREDFGDINTLSGLVGEVYRQTALAFEAIQIEINRLSARLASYKGE
jgi:hypothetical protein